MLRYLATTLPRIAWNLRPGGGPPTVRTRHRVSLADVDLNRHMNQAAYPRVAELARVTWLLRSGALQRWRAAGVNPIVARQTIVYRRELKPLQAFEIDTRAVGLDGRLLEVQHRLLVGDRVHAKLDLALLLVGPGGVQSAERVRELTEGLVVAPLRVEAWRVVD